MENKEQKLESGAMIQIEPSAITKIVGDVADIAIAVFFGDKASAAVQREIRRIILDVHAGKTEAKDGYQAIRFRDGDALDRVLGEVDGFTYER